MNEQTMIEDIRTLIRNAREAAGKTETEVNQAYFDGMVALGCKPPKAIMTKVRDKRKNLEFSEYGAKVLAEILNISATSLLPAQSPQAELDIIVKAEDDAKEAPSGESSLKADETVELETAPVVEAAAVVETTPVEEAKAIVEAEPAPVVEAAPVADAATSQKATEESADTKMVSVAPDTTDEQKAAQSERKVSAGFYETTKGLMFLINMELPQHRYKNLILAVPEYMMETEERGEKIYCRAKVPIFPYQAELIMRAIFGEI